MAYERQNFVDGNPLSAAELDHIEEGIVEIENRLNKEAAGIVDIKIEEVM